MRLTLILALALPAFGQFFSGQFTAQAAAGKTSALTTCTNFQPARCASAHTIDLKPTSQPGTCTYKLEGSVRPATESLTDADYYDLSGNIDCSVAVMTHVVNRIVRSIRGNLTVLSGTTATASDCTNANPIEVTTGVHGLVTGTIVTITGVTGNTACNVTAVAITVTSTTKFTVPVAGNGAYAAGGAVVTVPTVAMRYVGGPQ